MDYGQKVSIDGRGVMIVGYRAITKLQNFRDTTQFELLIEMHGTIHNEIYHKFGYLFGSRDRDRLYGMYDQMSRKEDDWCLC